MSRFLISLFLFLVIFSCNNRLAVRDYKAINMPIIEESFKIDSTISAFIKPYSDSLDKQMSRLIAVSNSALVAAKPESNLTNMISDIIFEYGTKYCQDQNLNIKPDIAYVNYGGLRSSIPKGDIIVRKIFELMPFENELVIIKISGESIMEMAEKIASRGGEGISGMKIGIKERMAKTVLVNGEVPDLSSFYWLVTNDYVAEGGDQMDMFLNRSERISTKMKIRDIIIESLSERYKRDGVIDAVLDGRIYNEQ